MLVIIIFSFPTMFSTLWSLDSDNYVRQLFCRFEGGGHTGKRKQGIEGFPKLTDISDVFSLETTLSWFDSLLAPLDCYSWVFGENLLSAEELFGGKSQFIFNFFYKLESGIFSLAVFGENTTYCCCLGVVMVVSKLLKVGIVGLWVN